MSFTYTDEQSMLDETLTALLEEFRHQSAIGEDYCAVVWQKLTELGLPAMPFEEADGGLGSSSADQMVVQRAIGRSALDLPFLSNSIVAGGMVASLARQAWTSALFASLIAGDSTLSLAHNEPLGNGPVTTAASSVEGGFVLSGTKSKALHGDRAAYFLVSATLSEAQDPSLFLVPADAKGVSIASNGGLPGVVASDIRLDNVLVPADSLFAGPAQAVPSIRLALDRSLVATVHEMVGAMERLQELTVDYLKLRKQFGVALGTFQSLQHKAVDMYVELEQARSMAIYANAMLAADQEHRHAAAVAAKLQVNKGARFVGETAVQLHGAIGMTMESETGRLFRRLTALQFLFADSDQCLAELGARSASILED
ncbi:Acyl-CoA dehydrogenase [Hyphomicrobiales bacterium]|nr:Acyl-CoA dehydrogenase [Hyphomicrobiales bacterium]CAH1675701.1 Acyl-CoA dehydrogenase [Hyphomicrobiales bacterium]